MIYKRTTLTRIRIVTAPHQCGAKVDFAPIRVFRWLLFLFLPATTARMV